MPRAIEAFFARSSCSRPAVARRSEIASRMLDYLVHWLTYHILGQDQNMARQIASVRAGMDAAAAFAAEEREQDAAIEPLLKALNALLTQLSSRNRDLVALNRSLEERVAERTRALWAGCYTSRSPRTRRRPGGLSPCRCPPGPSRAPCRRRAPPAGGGRGRSAAGAAAAAARPSVVAGPGRVGKQEVTDPALGVGLALALTDGLAQAHH